MAIEMRQQMKMTQQLVMTPQLQQAIKLLQLSRLELQDLVRQEMEENPLLEESQEAEEVKEQDLVELSEKEDAPAPAEQDFREVTTGEETRESDWDSYLEGYNYSSGEQYYDDEDRPSYENILTRKGTLADHLMWQLNMTKLSDEEARASAEIIGNIDEDGYLRATVEEVALACSVSESVAESALKKIQEFDPMGVGARSLRECLLIQVEQLGMAGSVVDGILRNHLHDLETRKYKQIAKSLGVDVDSILMAAKIIAGLDPKPGRVYGSEDVHYISADIFVYKIADDYVVVLNDEGLPNLRISPFYAGEIKNGAAVDAKAEEYINEKSRSAMWLIKSIHQRQRTIYKVAKSIVKFQREFLDRGIEHLRPLVLRDVAEDIGMHESTISRVTTNKYMQTPQGLFEMKYFFNSGISTTEGDFIASESVKNKIKEIVDSEDPRKPYSDQRIAELLSAHTINIARRTVTKYREMLKIGSSSERKRHF
ncbi:RNA polymerase factor sigma-54 [Geobacter sulfurreducens]|uniref:RNA polymerase sigma-54 factor RpoN n=1 Tax=Geobacter sulfurreducens (strain ATCC 51573 / DSM 12127 / PCA) TaxID=243231 RepID=Q74BZ1_GEOSL|nr:RNA polymerase factor sigma-54 [Geobacter sulfurreducens]AAR35263.1 RNA polymerase sigma-54 factor RpoN [Geobacter sulfurreducens PCA]UAC02629.1 RNA polymerase factor sigma-54 [Geobacter sulfurreducens]HBB70249.1 RNA polymerase sigma-54 factor [Geobacter sulfurreducens]HCD94703.1 RNA polymerase sigma-54 factor [Geobacter sulfurreducens]